MTSRTFVTDLYPAIDLRGGRCVRLVRGRREAEIEYDEDSMSIFSINATSGGGAEGGATEGGATDGGT